MKKIFVPVLAVLALASCQKSYFESGKRPEAVSETVDLTVSIPEVQTKLTDISGEDAVQNLQVYVFNTSGNIEKYGTDEGNHVTLTCTTGDKKIAALVNAAPLQVSTLSELQNAKSQLEQNAKGKLVMAGCKDEILTTSTTVTVAVTRLAAKIVLKSIKTDFSLAQHKTLPFVVNNIYVQNVSGECAYMADLASTGLWYNKAKLEADCPAFLADKGLGMSLNNGETYSTAHSFYCYQNTTATDSRSETWSPRFTRLVVEATLGGVTYYYPKTFTEIRKNTVYTVNLTVTQPGTTNPDDNDFKINEGFEVEINPWDILDDINETI